MHHPPNIGDTACRDSAQKDPDYYFAAFCNFYGCGTLYYWIMAFGDYSEWTCDTFPGIYLET